MESPESKALWAELVAMQARIRELQRQLCSVGPSEPLTPPDAVLLCRWGGERFALAVEAVEKVLPMCRLATIPQMPPWVLGILDLHGEALPAMLLQGQSEAHRRPVATTDFLVVCGLDGRRFAIVVEQIDEVRPARDLALRELPAELAVAAWVRGLLRTGEALAYYVDLASFLRELPATLFEANDEGLAPQADEGERACPPT